MGDTLLEEKGSVEMERVEEVKRKSKGEERAGLENLDKSEVGLK